MEKYHKTDIAPVEQENERDENYRASNPQIDCRRTGGNYHIVKRQRSYTQFISDKIAALDLPTKVRKDAVLMCSFVVGSGGAFFKNLSLQEQEKFFAECTRFFAERYGEGNIISAIVHMDETTPKRKRQAEEELSALRTENVALRQSKVIADRDRSDLFEQLQKAERRAKGKEQAFGMVSDMLAAYPDEFDALLNKSRAKNSAPSFQSNGNARGGK